MTTAALILGLASLAGQAVPTADAPSAGTASEGYRLVWSDEFATPGLPDPALWTYDTSANKTGWYNNEAQYYSAGRPENARIEDGNLIIEARRETLDAATYPDHGGQSYTSARMDSTGPGWTYGLFEVRARLPCARGTWPAIWMLPRSSAEHPEQPWPLGGEIDIMEHVGHEPGVVHGTVHTGAFNHVIHTERGGPVTIPDLCEAFHRYQTEWTPQAVIFKVDDVEFYRFANDGTNDPAHWPFDKPYHLILNVAVGGDWGGAEGIDDAALPQRMDIDYVRVFQKTE